MKTKTCILLWGLFLLISNGYAQISNVVDMPDNKLEKLWEIDTIIDDYSSRCVFSRDKRHFVYTEHNSLIIYDLQQRKIVDKITYTGDQIDCDLCFCFVAISPDNRYIAASPDKGGVKVWSYPSKKLILDCKGYEYYYPVLKKRVSSSDGFILFSSNIRYLLVDNFTVGTRVWALDQDSVKEVSTFYDYHFTSPPSGFGDNEYLLLRHDNTQKYQYTVKLYDVNTLECVGMARINRAWCALSPNATEIVYRSDGNIIRYIWKKKKKISIKAHYPEEKGTYLYSPSGQHIISIGYKTEHNSTEHNSKNIAGYCSLTAYDLKRNVAFREKFDFRKCVFRKNDEGDFSTVKGFFITVYFSPDGKFLTICTDEAIRFYKNPF